MKQSFVRAAAISAAVALAAATVRAQFVVYDPTNYVEAVATYEQLIQQYEFLLQQAKRLPVDMATRYHAHSLDWTLHDLTAGLLYAQPLLTALNQGDPTGTAYRQTVDPLDVPTDIVGRMSVAMRQRLATAYATIELADSTNRLAVDQTGTARAEGPFTLQAVKNVEHDAANPADAFQSQTALLEKIDAALAINVRLGEITNQFQLSTVEQALVESTRKRDTEAALMDATIHQWRYGQAYGADLFSRTAANIDAWHPY